MNRIKKSTMTDLVAELQKLPQSPQIDEMIAEAKAGEYHDFKNQKYACGKVESYNRLQALGYKELADRIADGEFDEEADAADVAELKKIAPPALHDVLKLNEKPTDEALMDKVIQMVHRQRVKANNDLKLIYSQTKNMAEMNDALMEIEIYCTHLIGLCYTNLVKKGIPLKELMDRHQKKMLGEMDFIAEHSIELTRQG